MFMCVRARPVYVVPVLERSTINEQDLQHRQLVYESSIIDFKDILPSGFRQFARVNVSTTKD